MTENQVRVSNIHWKADETALKEFLSPYGSISEMKIIYDRNKRSRGISWIL